MFCTKCGSQCPDNATFCTSCGNALNAAPTQPVYTEPVQPTGYTEPTQQPQYQQPQYQQPVQPQYQQPVYQAPAKQPVQIDPATPYQKKMALIIALISIFALVIGVMHTFCLVDLPISLDAEVSTKGLGSSLMGSMDYDDYEMGMTSAVPSIELDGSVGNIYVTPSVLSELFDLVDTASNGAIDASFGMGYTGLIVFGIINLLIAAVGVLYYLRARINLPVYDSICGFIKAKSPALIIGLLGVAACLIEIICMNFAGFNESAMGMSVGVSVGVHWITWIALIAYGALAASQLLAIDKTEE